ncbi:DNA polymerase III subunit gamma/tau [Candidatus Beckwithbacteria bacterium]|nr:DNA polymerase III subunit gamma/tau [Candidatus Beckwithbacteria bacterium]
MTFYLKYRPQTIDELDLATVRKQLGDVLKSDSIPHAFLFSGARGLGKTSAARIVAKSINCTNKKKGSIEPCNQCDACTSITKGMAVDVVEIDGASNRGIDDIRALRETIAQAPLNLAKKVYVIDEVHMLTREAFNALLKTLEEPPEHVVFILATTEPQKLPETIISRSFHVQFQKASHDELKRSLQRVIIGEELQISDEVLDKIIVKADGGFRDSTKMLEQLSFAGKKIDEQTLIAVFPQVSSSEFLQFLQKRQANSAFDWIAQQENQGTDWENVIRSLLIELKESLLANYGVNSGKKSLFSEAELQELITLLLRAGWQLKNALVPTLPLELVVAEWCHQELKTKSEKLKIEEELEIKMQKPEHKSEIKDQNSEEQVVVAIKQTASSKQEPATTKAVNCNFSLDDLVGKWETLLTIIKPQNHSVEALLHSARPHQVSGNEVQIKVFYEFHKGRLETDKSLQIVEEAFIKLYQSKPRIVYVLGEKQEKQELDEKKDQNLAKMAEEIFT